MKLYADGWYAQKQDAERVLAACVSLGATAVGIVESEGGTWGILYWAPRELFSNHTIDGSNAMAVPLRDRLTREER